MRKILLALALVLSPGLWAAVPVYAVNDGSIYTTGTWQLTETGTGAQLTTITAANTTTLAAFSTVVLPVGYSAAFTITSADVVRGVLLYGEDGADTSGTVTVLLYNTANTSNNISSITQVNGGAITVNTLASHGMSTNDWVSINATTGSGSGFAAHANCTCQITVTSTTQFTLNGITGTSGTYTSNVGVWNHVATDGTPGHECKVTLNETDMQANGNPSWMYIKFPYTFTSASTTSIYRIGIYTTSTTGMPVFFTNGTAFNWNRLLPLNATKTLAAIDYMYVVGHITTAGSPVLNTVTADDWSTVATANSWAAATGVGGSTPLQRASLDVGAWGTFKYPTDSSGLSGTAVLTASNASPIVCTVTASAPATGTTISITGATGNTAANGTWVVTNTNSTTFSLNGSTGNGSYNASSGTWVYSACYEQFAGNVNIWGGGTLTMGIPAAVAGAVACAGGTQANAVTNIMEFNEGTTNVQYGLIVNNGGYFYTQGYNFSGGAGWTTLAADYPLPPVTSGITNITQANPAVVTVSPALAYAPTAGTMVILASVGGMTQAIGSFTVAASPTPSTTAFGLTGINATNYTAYTTGGTAYFPYTVTAVTANGPPAIITVSPAISGGAPAANSYVTVNGALVNTAINGVWQVSSASTTGNVTTISLTSCTGSGTYTANSGQLWTQLTATTTLNPTGWLNGDTIVFAPTNRTYTESETQTLNGPASGATLTLNATLDYTHGGGTAQSLVIGECGDLTRNVKIRGITSAYNAYISCTATSTTNITWTECYYFGATTVSNQGIIAAVTSGTFVMQYSSIYTNLGGYGFDQAANITTGSVNFSYNVMYNITAATSGIAIFTNGTSPSTIISYDLVILGGTPNGSGAVYLGSYGNSASNFPTFTYCSVCGCPYFGVYVTNSPDSIAVLNTFSNNTVHSNGNSGLDLKEAISGTISNCKVWRSVGGGGFDGDGQGLTFSNCTFFGNSAGVVLGSNNTFSSCVFDAGITLLQPSGISISSSASVGNNVALNDTLISCVFGGNQTFASGDFQIYSTTASKNAVSIQLYSCYLHSASPVLNQAGMNTGSFICASEYQQTPGSFIKWQPEGTCINDQTIVRSGGYSEQCKPNQASTGTVAAGTLHSSNQQARVKSGKTYTVGCYVRASVSTDTAGAYTGNNPRIILRANYNAGPVTTDTDVADITPNSAVITSSAATNGVSPIDCNTAGAHGLNTGDYVYISGATGDTAMNGNWQVTKTSSTAFTLNSSISNGTYGASSAKFGQWVYATYTTGTVSDNTVLQFCVGCDGTAGQVNVDWAQNSGDTNWWNGEHQNFLTSNAGSTQ